MTDLYRIVYISRNEIDGDLAVIREEITQILTASRRNNPHVGVTGALMFSTGCFAQVLEGTHDAIQSIFERIQCDDRHSRVELLSFDAVAERRFASWSMGYAGADTRAVAEFAELLGRSEVGPDELTGDRIDELLHLHLLESEPASA